MSKQTALILGANSDIAKNLIYLFAENNFNLILTARNLESLEIIKKDIEIKYDVYIQIIKLDILETSEHQSFYNFIGLTPDVVVDAIGLLGDQQESFKNFNHAKNIIDTNLTAQISILDIIANDMMKQNAKSQNAKNYSIIGISSVAGDRGKPDNYTYGAAKAGFTVYLSGLRAALKKYNINVLTVKPGVVATKMTDHLSFPSLITAEPEKVANSIFKAYKKNKYLLYTPRYWQVIMGIIKVLPEWLFVKVFSTK